MLSCSIPGTRVKTVFSLSFTIAARIIRQLIRDRRTFGLMIVVPLVVMALIGLSFPDTRVLDVIAPALLATMSLFYSFLLTGISFLRERSQGTMERLMVSPVSRPEIVIGYLFGFFLFALAQTLIIVLFTIYVLGVQYSGDLWQIFVFQIAIITVAVNLGIFTSVFARNEFQMVQFIPLMIFPQIFLCGVIWPVEQMPEYLQWIAKFLPLKYGVDGLKDIMLLGKSLADVSFEFLILLAFAVGTLMLAALSIRRGSAG